MKLPVLKESAGLRYLTFFYLYVMQGIPAGFALTAIANYLIGKNVAPEKVGTFIAYVGLPWILQFLWGPFIDRFQASAMGNRKQWVVSSQWAAIIASLGLLNIHSPEKNLGLLSVVFFIHSIFASIQVASVDAMAITTSPADERGKMNGFMRGGFLLGVAFSSTVLSFVMHSCGFPAAALIQTLAMVVCSLLFFFTRPEKGSTLVPSLKKSSSVEIAINVNPDFKVVFRKIYKGILRAKSLQYFLVVSFVYFCSSVFIRSFTYHLINVMRWPDKTVSVLQGGWGSMVTFVAIIIAGIKSDSMGPKKMQIKVMWAVCCYLLILNATFKLWHFNAYSGFALILWNLADPLLSVCIFPILMGLCLKKVEGSQFTTYLALINFCDVLGSYVTGWSLKLVSAPFLGLSCGFAMLFLLLGLKMYNNYKVIPNFS